MHASVFFFCLMVFMHDIVFMYWHEIKIVVIVHDHYICGEYCA